MYNSVGPRLWNETIEAHRREVREAILETTWALVAEHGVLSVTMSQIAEKTGIGRATLYNYFPDVEAILLAWHERGISGHLEHLVKVRDEAGDARGRLEAVLHKGGHVARAHGELWGMIRDLISDAARTGEIRDDVSPAELASYCIH